MKSVIVSALIAAGLIATPAMANKDLAAKSGCMACHVLSGQKTVGPAYSDVAKKYASDKTAEVKVIESITKGGAGKWGPVPMPPKGGGAVSDADIKVLAKWILAGAK